MRLVHSPHFLLPVQTPHSIDFPTNQRIQARPVILVSSTVSPALRYEPPAKIWLSDQALEFLKEYKEKIAETKNSVALISLIRIGLKANGDGRYGGQLKSKNIAIGKLRSHGVRIKRDLDTEVRRYGGKNDLNLSQAYFDLVCFGLAASHFGGKLPSVNGAAGVGSILVC